MEGGAQAKLFPYTGAAAQRFRFVSLEPEAVGGARKQRRDAGFRWHCSCRMIAGGGGKRRPGGEGQQVLLQRMCGIRKALWVIRNQGAAHCMYPVIIEWPLRARERRSAPAPLFPVLLGFGAKN